MNRKSIEAYDLPERVAAYDAEMELMHPNRPKMVTVALEVLPFEWDAPLRALDLGVGTGYFTARFLEAYPRSTVYAVDGAAGMIDLARARLGDTARSVHFRLGDFRELGALLPDVDELDAVYSSYALHHLTPDEKTSVTREAVGILLPGGWFVNADIILAEEGAVEERIQQLRVEGIVERAGGSDERFRDEASTGRYIEQMEAEEGDRPLTLAEDLALFRQAGLRNVAVYWQEYREAVIAGQKGKAP